MTTLGLAAPKSGFKGLPAIGTKLAHFAAVRGCGRSRNDVGIAPVAVAESPAGYGFVTMTNRLRRAWDGTLVRVSDDSTALARDTLRRARGLTACSPWSGAPGRELTIAKVQSNIVTRRYARHGTVRSIVLFCRPRAVIKPLCDAGCSPVKVFAETDGSTTLARDTLRRARGLVACPPWLEARGLGACSPWLEARGLGA
jgi:hypothetical protein